MKIENLLNGNTHIEPPDSKTAAFVKARWDAVAKPLDSMGCFEEITAKIGAISGSADIDITKKTVLVFIADNGIVEEGISQSGQEVTLAVARAMGCGVSSVCKMAEAAGIDVVPIDIGVNSDENIEGIVNAKIRRGTRNFIVEPAMTTEETIAAMQTGFDAAVNEAEKGSRLICLGEMGIGNTATSAAVVAALTERKAADVTGRGSGLTNEALKKKEQLIDEAIEKYGLYNADALTVLSAVGGLDIAGMAGAIAGAALSRIPVILDGVVSCAAALAAERIFPGVRDYLIASHMSKEPSAQIALNCLGLHPVIDASLALGEGTGAVMMCTLLDDALTLYSDALTFGDIQIDSYKRIELM